jgi:anti-anti-sigma regulatory factor
MSSAASHASIEHEDHSEVCRTIKLSGRLDMVGTESISITFASLAAAKGRRLIVDLREVTSVGIRRHP